MKQEVQFNLIYLSNEEQWFTCSHIENADRALAFLRMTDLYF